MNPLEKGRPGSLVVRNGTVMDPVRGIHDRLDVIIENGRIQALEESSKAHAYSEIDASGKLVVPGLIDLHTHVYWGGSSISINIKEHLIRSGVTTWVDAGSAGAGNFLISSPGCLLNGISNNPFSTVSTFFMLSAFSGSRLAPLDLSKPMTNQGLGRDDGLRGSLFIPAEGCARPPLGLKSDGSRICEGWVIEDRCA